MKKPILRIISIVFILTCLLNNESFASHLMGAEIMYTLDSGTTYTVTVMAYRDCNGTQLDGTGLYAIDGSSSVALNPDVCCGMDITPVNERSCDRCISNPSCNFGYGVEQWLIAATVDVSQFNDCNLIFEWSEYATPTLTNIDNSNGGLLVSCTLNRCKAEHSSPQFLFLPRPFVLVNQLDHEFISVKPGNVNDSIVYHLSPPYNDAKTKMEYDTPFTYLSPMYYEGFPNYSGKKPKGFHYDSKTGEFYFTPTREETTIAAWEADEYAKDSNGKYYLASTAERTLELLSLANNFNHPPDISSMNISKSDTIYSCANIPIKFTVYASDSDSGDKDSLYADNETNGTVNIPKGAPDTAHFSWTPTNLDVRPQPYILTLSAMDNGYKGYPLYGFSQRQFYIVVKDSQPVTGIRIIDSGCGLYYMGLKQSINKGYNESYNWVIDHKPLSSDSSFSYFNDTVGRHILSLTITNSSGCSESYSDTILFDLSNSHLKHDTSICQGGSIQIVAVKNKALSWSPTIGLSDSIIYNPVATPDSTTVYAANGIDSNNCPYKDYEKITVYNYKLVTSGGNDTICSGTAIQLYANYYPGIKYTWKPTASILDDYGDSVLIQPDSTTHYLVTGTVNGCTRKDSLTVIVNPVIATHTEIDICEGDSVTLHAASNGSSYQWIDLVHNSVVWTDSILKLKPLAYDEVFVATYINNNTKCIDSEYFTVRVKSFNLSISQYSVATCKNGTVSLSASGGTTYVWYIPGTGPEYLSKISFIAQDNTNVNVTIANNTSGCSRTYNIPVYIAPTDSTFPSLKICRGETVTLADEGGASYTWQPSTGLDNSHIAHPKASPSITTIYRVTVADSLSGCLRIDSVTVIVDTDCVWPGDANNDGIANYLDVLNIGLGYGAKGPSRSPDSTNWRSWPVDNWYKSLANGINFKHFDCNGDGIIDAKDTSVISANYGLTHNKWTPGTGNPSDPPVYFKFTKDTFYAGDTATAYLYAGTSGNPLRHAYGIGYQAYYQANPMVTGSAMLQPFCDYFCTGRDLNYIHPFYASHTVDAASVETNGIGTTNGYGEIASLQFILKDSLNYAYPRNGEKIYADLLSATAIDSAGKELNIYGKNDSAIVLKSKPQTGGINLQNNITSELQVYPNPAQNELIVDAHKITLRQVSLYNELGQEKIQFNPINQKSIIDVSALSPGIYFIELQTDKGTAREKVVIER